MNPKKKSHGVLFTPYLQKGEDLLWVGMPVKNPYLSFQFDRVALERFLFIFLVVYVFSCVAFASQLEYTYLLSETGWIMPRVLGLIVLPFSFTVLAAFARFGKVYYAITTKRLLVMRRPFWKSLDANALILLPEFRLENHENKIASVLFAPLHVEEAHQRGYHLREASSPYVEIHRANLEELSQEDAELAYDLLEAARNDVLDKRARELGLMD